MMRIVLLTPFLLLASCGSGPSSPGGVSPEEDRLLNEAASSLDANFMTAPDNGTTDAPADQGNGQ
jgi:hypothetical protein